MADYGRDEPSPREKILDAIDDPEIRGLASSLYAGFNSTSSLDWTNATLATATAQAIDALIRKRIIEVLKAGLSPEAPPEPPFWCIKCGAPRGTSDRCIEQGVYSGHLHIWTDIDPASEAYING